jgi:hypothetical protein
MGNLPECAAELKIDVSPMEGLFLESQWIVGLHKLGYTASLLAAH